MSKKQPAKPVEEIEMPHTVVIVDESYTQSGIVAMKYNELLTKMTYKRWPRDTKKDYRRRLGEIVFSLVKLYEADAVIVEMPINRPSLHTQLLLFSLCVSIADTVEVPVYAVGTQSWKARVLGSRSATKQDAIDFVKKTYGIEATEHEADAICMGRSRYKGVTMHPIE